MRRCIYCLDEKDEVEFDREHLIPQAFGTFDSDTLVIDCVCKSCNGYFCDRRHRPRARWAEAGRPVQDPRPSEHDPR